MPYTEYDGILLQSLPSLVAANCSCNDALCYTPGGSAVGTCSATDPGASCLDLCDGDNSCGAVQFDARSNTCVVLNTASPLLYTDQCADSVGGGSYVAVPGFKPGPQHGGGGRVEGRWRGVVGGVVVVGVLMWV